MGARPSRHEPERVLRTKAEARASYDRLSRWYDTLSERSERPSRLAGLELLAAAPGEHVLELGFGTGRALVALTGAVGPEGRVVGIDLSSGMRRKAVERLGRAGLAGRVELIRGDACELPFDASRFDAIFSSFFLDLLDTPEIPECLGECRRVLAPGGRIVLVSMSSEGRPGLSTSLYLRAHRLFPRLVDCRPVPVERSLAREGFAIVRSLRRSMWGLAVEVVLASSPLSCPGRAG